MYDPMKLSASQRIPLLEVPAQLTRVTGNYWKPNPQFLGELTAYLEGKRVLEIFAGNGYLAALLDARGVEIRATTQLSGHDTHEIGIYHPIEEMQASAAVERYGDDCDVLLVSWPTVTPAVLHAAQQWGREKPIVFIGEITDYAKHHLGGCATDEFFEAVQVDHRFDTYKGNMMEAAVVYTLK